MSKYTELSDEEQGRILEAGLRRARLEPMPPELKRIVQDLIEPHTINMSIEHDDVMDCIDVAFPAIRDWLRENGVEP